METDPNAFTKQCIYNKQNWKDNEDVIVLSDYSDDCNEMKKYVEQELRHSSQSFTEEARIDNPNYDEPIDLTSTHRPDMNLQNYTRTSENCTVVTYTVPSQSIAQSNQQMASNIHLPEDVRYDSVMGMQFVSRPRGRRRRIEFDQEGKMINIHQVSPSDFANGTIDQQTAEAKQIEVLKAAKSLFSKRTRTLYHWMYPNSPKAQIKAAVASSWESLGNQEKEFYVSQVLGRFGFPQCSLMINPQLGGIKELPPLPDTEIKHSTNELQNAISSISPGSLYDIANERHRLLRKKKRQGRPPGSRNRKYPRYETANNCDMTQDFQDDPELSKELQQFALTLNMNTNMKQSL